jgi:hypothetical protein
MKLKGNIFFKFRVLLFSFLCISKAYRVVPICGSVAGTIYIVHEENRVVDLTWPAASLQAATYRYGHVLM